MGVNRRLAISSHSFEPQKSCGMGVNDMRQITDYFGTGFLHLVTAFCMFGIIAVFWHNKGLICDLAAAFMYSVCGN